MWIAEYEKEVTVLEVPGLYENTGNYGIFRPSQETGHPFIIIEYKQPEVDKESIIVEEFKHYLKSVGVIIDESKLENRRQENQARTLAYKELISIDDLVDCYELGLQTSWEIAEELQLPPEFIQNALEYFKTVLKPEFTYHTQYGDYKVVVGSTINFYKLTNSSVK